MPAAPVSAKCRGARPSAGQVLVPVRHCLEKPYFAGVTPLLLSADVRHVASYHVAGTGCGDRWMARKLDRLTDRSIRAKGIKIGTNTGKPTGYYVADGDGLFCRFRPPAARALCLDPSGTARPGRWGWAATPPHRSWRPEKAQEARRVGVGVETPFDARDAMVAQERAEEARSTTFRECAEQFIATNEAGWGNPKHRKSWRNSTPPTPTPSSATSQSPKSTPPWC